MFGSRSIRFALLSMLGALALLSGSPLLARDFATTASEREQARQLLQMGRDKAAELDYRAAVTALNQAILLAPDEADPYFERGLIRTQLEDEIGALSDFDDAILRDPRHARAYFQRAGVLFSLGSSPEAVVDLRQAAQLFEAMGDRERSQQAQALLEHFNRTLPVQ